MALRSLKHHKLLVIIFPFIFILSSCLGLSMDIVLNQNGSGTITLEYIISKQIDSLGKLDGNEQWNTIPIGKADFERTMDRLQDVKMVSFSSKEDEVNIMINAKMEFESLQGLIEFLDSGSRRSTLSGDGSQGRLLLTLAEAAESNNPLLDVLLRNISEPYSFNMSMSFPKEGSVNFINSQGFSEVIPGADIKSPGKVVSCSFPIYSILSSERGIIAEFQW